MSLPSRPIREVSAELAALEARMRRQGDANAHFVSMYRVTTERCRRTVDAITDRRHPRHAAMRHLDPRLITDIVRHFAPRYVEPRRAYERSTLDDANPWLRVFRAARCCRPAGVLLLGAHTHICFDLPAVLASRIGPGIPLFDPADPHQSHTLAVLSRIFMADLTRIVARVRRGERELSGRPGVAAGGLLRVLYPRYARALLQAPLTGLLAAARTRARSDAVKLRQGSIDEATLAASVDRRNRVLLGLSGWRPVAHGYNAAGQAGSQRR